MRLRRVRGFAAALAAVALASGLIVPIPASAAAPRLSEQALATTSPGVRLQARCGVRWRDRFFALRNGSHFYTASDDEKNSVIAKYPTVYQLEGPAFWIGQ